MTITSEDINCLVSPAMRYALGRKSVIADTVPRTLIRLCKIIRSDIKFYMCEEIEKAIKEDKAGMECDVQRWKDVVAAFRGEPTSWDVT